MAQDTQRETKTVTINTRRLIDLVWPILTLVVGALIALVFSTKDSVQKQDGDIKVLFSLVQQLNDGQTKIESSILKLGDKLDRVLEKK